MHADSLTLEAKVLTDRGCVRQLNEDSATFVCPSDQASLEAKGALALVADGMGGHQAGEVASALAALVVRQVYYRGPARPGAALVEALEAANRAIFTRATSDDGTAGMGTTCTALAIHHNLAYLAHVGDSRLYLLRGGDLLQMSEDHSQVAEMVRRGMLTADEARDHEERNVITRALGSEPEVEVATWPRPFPLRGGDRLLLSSDGLHDPLERDTIRDLIASGNIHTAGERLLAAAKERGAPDNVSLVLLSVGDRDEDPRQAARETRKTRVLS